MDAFFTSSGLVALITLTFLEIVLGVDNVIFISILASKLPGAQQQLARRMGLLIAMGMRILLLLSVVWIVRLTTPLFYILERPISGRDLILIGGGLFLLAKATIEIHDRLEGEEGHSSARVRLSFAGVISQIALLDIVFSLDSVITAVGMAQGEIHPSSPKHGSSIRDTRTPTLLSRWWRKHTDERRPPVDSRLRPGTHVEAKMQDRNVTRSASCVRHSRFYKRVLARLGTV